MSDQLHHVHESHANGKDCESAEVSEEDSHRDKDTAEEWEEPAELEELESCEEEDEDHLTNGLASEEGTESSNREDALVSIVTADFAMQNLILQLGLQLVSPDGRRIKRISRWALRCSACFKVTKVSSRRFPLHLQPCILAHLSEHQGSDTRQPLL